MTIPTTALLLALLVSPSEGDPPVVEVVRVPGGGVQPRAVVDAGGVTHLVFLRGEPGGSDAWYAARKPGASKFEAPVRVDPEVGSAIAIGTVRGAQVAVGRGGRVHVAWNGSEKAKPANPLGGSPLLYARSDEARGRFEAPRNLMTRTQGLDGGGSIASDGRGNVYVAWHGQARGSVGEANRRVWVARSTDDGATFAAEEPASAASTGACGCCGIGALVDSDGSVYLSFRAATEGLERGMVLLTSRDRGRGFHSSGLDSWRLNACPMSTTSLAEGRSGVLVAWEARGQVGFARVDRESGERSTTTSPQGGRGDRKHPALAVDAGGRILLAWTEETAWQKGGSLAWQAFDPSGRPLGPPGRVAGGVPTWGFSAVVARPGGGFTIVR